jgi:hypothetical protein
VVQGGRSVHGENGGEQPVSNQRVFDPVAASIAQKKGRLRIREKRTDAEAKTIRLNYRHGHCSAEELHRAGYHPTPPFSIDYPYGGINDAVGPDLLHQATKCFMDVLINNHIHPLLVRTWRSNGITPEQLNIEIDARLSLVPPWTGMRCFKEGIMSQDHHWSCHEYKDMMRQIIGCFIGLCPSEGITLFREYLHIHRLSHYAVHTETSLEWLESAVITFSDHLREPKGPFARYMRDNGDFEVQRIHYFRHYADTVREKGALSSYSTDRTEIWHKWLKTAWFRSNHGADALEFVLREHTQRCAFQEMFDSFKGCGGGDEDLENRPLVAEDDEEFEGPSPGLHSAEDVPAEHVIWPKYPRKHWRTVNADQTEKLLELEGFHKAIQQYLQKNDLVHSDWECGNGLNPRILVYNSITVTYNPWCADEQIQSDPEAPPYVPPSQRSPKSDRLYASSLRHNTVLVRCPDRKPRGNLNTMSFKRVAQLLLLFQVPRRANDENSQKLAYVSWFETKSMKHSSSGLYLVSRTTKASVIAVEDIERGVHLVPKFGANVGEAIKLKCKFQEANVMWKIQMQTASIDIRERYRLEVLNERAWSSLSHYSEFWLNSFVDLHAYKNIF